MTRTNMTPVRLTPNERAALERAARVQGCTLSDALRAAIHTLYMNENGVGHESDRAALLRTIQTQDAEIQRLKAQLYEVTP